MSSILEYKPLFSVLIASYNNGRFILQAIASVNKQTYDNWEIVIVDDYSTDDSVQVISDYMKSDARVRLYQNDKNYGCGYTKARCAELSKGEIAGFLDPDDALTENALELSIAAHIGNPEASLIYSNCYVCDSDLNIKSSRIVSRIPENKMLMECFLIENVSVFHFATFKLGLYNKTGGIDPYYRRAVDQDLFYKLEEVGKLFHIPDLLYKYRVHKGGLSLGSSTVKAISWHFQVLIEACKRRGLNFEDFIPELIQRDIVNQLKKRQDFKVGRLVLKPFRFVKRLIN